MSRRFAIIPFLFIALSISGCGSLPKYSAWSAIVKDDKSTLVKIAENDSWVLNDLNGNGYNALHLAAKHSADTTIQYLISIGFNINEVALDGVTPLILAIRSKSPSTVSLLLERGARVDQVFPFSSSPIIESIDLGLDNVTDRLLSLGADVNEIDQLGRTPLAAAALHGNPRMVAQLLDRGADINYTNPAGWQPVHFAALSGDVTTIRLLLNNGAKADPIETPDPSLEDLIASTMTCAVAANNIQQQSGTSIALLRLEQCRDKYKELALITFDEKLGDINSEVRMKLIGNALNQVFATAAAGYAAKSNTVITKSGEVVGVGVATYPVSSTSNLKETRAFYRTMKTRFIDRIDGLKTS